MRFSDLLEKPLLSLSEGTVLGQVKGCLLNMDKTRLLALSLGEEWVLAQDVTVGEGAVVVKSSSALLREFPQNAVLSPLYLELFCADGTALGEIKDLIFDEKYNLTAFSAGGEEFPRSLMLSAGDNAVVVCRDEEQYRRERRRLAASRRRTEKPSLSDVGKVSSAGSFNYLLGRRVTEDIFNQRNEKIVKKNSVVSVHTLQVCREYGRLLLLAKNSRAILTK